MDFKVGDKVRIIDVKDETDDMYLDCVGCCGKIEAVHEGMNYAKVKMSDGRILLPFLHNIQLAYRKHPLENIGIDYSKSAFKKFTIKDLKERYLIVFRNGKLGVITRLCEGNHHVEFDIIENGGKIDKDQFNYKQDLTTFGDGEYHNWDIMAVEKPKYEQIWERPVEHHVEYKVYYKQPHSWTRVCTLKELEKELGYKIELWEKPIY